MILAIDTNKNVLPPDLTILVRRKPTHNSQFRFSYTLVSPKRELDIHYVECETEEINKNYEKILNEKFYSINQIMGDKKRRENLNNRLKSIGKELYKLLFSFKFDALYWDKIRNHVKTIQFISEENIPWELVYPVNLRYHEVAEKGFLCELYDISHWFPGNPPQDSIHIQQIALVNAICDASALREETEIGSVFGSHHSNRNIVVNAIQPHCQDVTRAIISQNHSILHLICHGTNEPEDADSSTIKLMDGRLSPDDIDIDIDSFDPSSSRNSLVFLNGCETGMLGPGLTGLGGWAFKLINVAKVNVVLGASWKIPSESACNFSTSFYKNLCSGYSIAEAARRARKTIVANDPTGLSYKIYASPLASLQSYP